MKPHLKLVVALRGMVLSAIILAALFTFAATPGQSTLPQLSATKPAMLIGTCEELMPKLSVLPNTNITSVKSIAAGEVKIGGNAVAKHCLVTGSMFERTGEPEGTPYAIGFEMRLPIDWNGRFWYQGNGGIDGSVKPALGDLGGGPVTCALLQGFAVISSDAGHDNRKTRGPGFGLDPQARLDYGYQAVGKLTPMAKEVIRIAYGKGPDRSYIGGCSNGGRHALVAAARYPEMFDGFLAGSPGFNLPKAAVANIFGAQQYKKITTDPKDLSTAFTTQERQTVVKAVLDKCDALDGATDGMIQDTSACQAKFDFMRDVPTCKGERDGSCLTTAQKEAIARLQVARGGDVRPHSTRLLLTKDGNKRHISWFHVIEQDSNHRPTGILSIGEDITELKKAQQALTDEKANMDVILSSLNTGLALMDPSLKVVWVNKMTREAFPWDDPVGKKCYSLAENRSEPCEGCGAAAAFADGRIHETERLNSLNSRWYHIVSVPIKDEDGRVVNVLESSTDITERKQTEAARDNALHELESLKAKLEEENIFLLQELQNQSGFDEIVGESNSLLYVLTRVKQVAETDATVLVQGETGVGKELIAKAIHQSSRRADKPFVKLNCAALPTNLVESELFGHEKGAFTGADRIRKGRFELADGGSLLLDEISELPLETQAKLLRVLQEGQFERVGGSQTLSVDVRIIATTNRMLKNEIIEGRFRSDLFYRLNVYPITVPPLRNRLEDIPLLVQYFVKQIASRIGKQIDQVPPYVMDRLRKYDWPGNVRELRNLLEQAVIH